MFQQLSSLLRRALTISPEDHVPAPVAQHFKHNVLVNTIDLMFFFFADSFWSIQTIIPVFAATLTDSPLFIGLMPAIANAGWFLPQLFMSGIVSRERRKLPLSRKMGIAERIPYLFFPLLALAIPHLSRSVALLFLFILMTFRGIASGFSALPWQEVMARVFPISHRARVFSISRVMGQLMGVLGSAIAALVLSKLDYPYNYALGFGLAVIAQWISFTAYSQNHEPEIEEPEPAAGAAAEGLDFALFGAILKRDANLRRYLLARSITFIGTMGSAFLAVYGINHFGLNDDQAAIFTGLLFASGLLGYAIWGAVGDRIGPKRMVTISLILWALALIVALTSPVIWVYYLVFVLYGIHNAGIGVGDLALVMELGDDSLRPVYLGMARTFTGGFLLVAPVIAGWLVGNWGYEAMFAASIAFTLLGAFFMNQVHDLPRVRQAEPQPATQMEEV